MSRPVRVAVAMSGGVDSSVAALLLHRQGYEVVGIMLRLWCEDDAGENACCTTGAVHAARRVADQIGIPFHVLDARDRFRESVVGRMIAEYSGGRTPNPCIECNRVIRWGYLLQQARATGAEFLASGHYARIRREENEYRLYKGRDGHKDQSYMLAALGQEELAHTLFPLGELEKMEVSMLARLEGFGVADKPDSQDLCFAPGGDYRRFLEKIAPDTVRTGPILHVDGRTLGWHSGTSGYTIGQRKGIGVSSPNPLYVVALDTTLNAVIVGPAESLGHAAFRAGPLHWIGAYSPEDGFTAMVKIRYQAEEAEAMMTPESGHWVVRLRQPLRDITPGQAAVFYENERCLGMATIVEALE